MSLIKLSSFKIQNYRSIIDSGWRTLANDNITVLIGQNESGKTSVLEALQSFYDNKLSEDVLRSDNTYPVVSCSFKICDNQKVSDLLEGGGNIALEIAEIIKNQQEFSLTRLWLPNRLSILYISSEKISDYFDLLEKDEKQKEEITQKAISRLFSESEKLFQSLEIVEKEKNNAQVDFQNSRKVAEAKEKIFKKTRKADLQLLAENEFKYALSDFKSKEEILNQKTLYFEQLKNRSQELSEKISVGKALIGLQENYSQLSKSIEEKKRIISDLEHIYDLSSNEKDKKNYFLGIQQSKTELEQAKQLIKRIQADIKISQLIANKVIVGGIPFRKADAEAKDEIIQKEKFLDKFQLGEELFKQIPVFEFFEDFSGLLPNKIDLEDVLNINQNIEGYKAARNFLKIAGLDSSFFREKNHRILKQRIETLNSDVTINFQDYWSQQVGKDNKIRLHFELEHYDYTVPEKSGKPYLEFWIKDNQDRLYPKQRSRGVRWFLSFYLELKATASNINTNRVLLIDEPGLSLHARAQEDVLKVFEDLKHSMQIIYCTHSPHLVKAEKIYRILAVQRSVDDNDKSETHVFEPSMLSEASADTLTPIYSLMGVRLANQQFIQATNNIIVSDTITYYYLHWLAKLLPDLPQINFLPATGLNTVPLLVNILAGWQLNFGLVLFGKSADEILEDIKHSAILNEDSSTKLKHVKQFDMPEDIFSTIDFKKFILEQRIGITDKNSEYIKLNNLSRKILAANFVNNINEGKLNLHELDETTQNNIKELFTDILKVLK